MSDLIEQEIISRLGSRWWRLNNLYSITDESGQHIPFRPNPAQRQLYREMHWLNVILKARQLGFSTFIQILILDASIFTPGIRAGVIAHTKDDAEVLFRDKIKYAYEHLPDFLRAEITAKNDRAGELVLSNGSSIRVGTSLRSGTLQYLHVSELGKIARKYPDKAEEIRAGALNTVHQGNFVFVESTAEGRAGLFFELCEEALKRQQLGREPNSMEFKLHFFPWWQDRRYRMDPREIALTPKEVEYFATLERTDGIRLEPDQQAWHAAKARVMKDKMLQEYPSTPKEAFEAKVEGAILADQMAQARLEGRVTVVPYEPTLPVNTFWDLGHNDTNVIWFHQRHGLTNRFFDYEEGNNLPLSHYARVLKERGYVYDTCYLPHDASITDLSREDMKSRAEVLESFGFRVEIVPKVQALNEGIEMLRQSIVSCWFDETRCDQGLKALEAYQREWDDKLGAYKDKPLHNWASNAADALRQFAQGYRAPTSTPSGRKRKNTSWRTA